MKPGARVRSFKYAFRGIAYNLIKGRNFQIQVLFGIAVIAAGIVFPISIQKWVLILICIGAVLAAEAMNTAIETTLDKLGQEQDERTKIAKDSAAGAVLIISATAALIGLIIFLPYLKSLFA